MNKQEAIEKIKEKSEHPGDYPSAIIRTPYVLEIINRIKTPQWVVKVNNMYFLNWGEDGTCPTFLINDQPNIIEQAEFFDSIIEAENVAEIFGGSVEIVH